MHATVFLIIVADLTTSTSARALVTHVALYVVHLRIGGGCLEEGREKKRRFIEGTLCSSTPTYRCSNALSNLDQLVHQLVQLRVLRLTVPWHLRIVALRSRYRCHQQLRIVANTISGPAEMIALLCIIIITVAVKTKC